MKKILLIQLFFLSLIGNAQETKTNTNQDICSCLVCGLKLSCENIGECEGRNFEGMNFSYKKKRPKGTHIYSLGTVMNFNPNPVIDFCTLTIDNEVYEDIYMMGYEIYDQNGNVVLQAVIPPTQSYTADFSSLVSGNYIINIQIDEFLNGSNIITHQFVKQ